MWHGIWEVSGKGRFPVDMLRYDRCWPATKDDVDAIIDSSIGLLSRDQVFRVGLRSSGAIKEAVRPTVQRWASFGWFVGSVQMFKG